MIGWLGEKIGLCLNMHDALRFWQWDGGKMTDLQAMPLSHSNEIAATHQPHYQFLINMSPTEMVPQNLLDSILSHMKNDPKSSPLSPGCAVVDISF